MTSCRRLARVAVACLAASCLAPLSGRPRCWAAQARPRRPPVRGRVGLSAGVGEVDTDEFETSTVLEGRSSPNGVVLQFATPVYKMRLSKDEAIIERLNAELLREAKQLQEEDEAGKEWCETHYQGGYTSYGTMRSLIGYNSVIQEMETLIRRHMRDFGAQAQYSNVRKLFMTDCWVNVMGEGTEHIWHRHGSSTISGTYYVQTPKGCSGICFEDPRADKILQLQQRPVVEYPVRAGDLVLFESWLRHRVPPNQGVAEGGDERVSVSFNYHDRMGVNSGGA